jgi:hypothetical protein
MRYIFSKFATLTTALVLSACSVPDPDTEEQVDLGNFSLGHNVAVTVNAQKVGPSRTASAEEWEEVIEAAIAKRFDRHEGEKLYHIALNLDAYALAIPGIPIVLSPKSIASAKLTVWDDAESTKLKEKPRQITVFEQVNGDTLLGSGLTQKKEEQMFNLAAQLSKAVQRYLLANGEWFGLETTEEAKAAAEKDVLTLPSDADATPAIPTDEEVPAEG